MASPPDLPPLPAACRQPTPHAPLVEGHDALVVLARERAQLDNSNAKQGACAAFYDRLRAGLNREGPKE